MTQALDDAENELLGIGLEQGTPAFERALRLKKAEMCRYQRGLNECRDCDFLDHCALAREIVADLRSRGAGVAPTDSLVLAMGRLKAGP